MKTKLGPAFEPLSNVRPLKVDWLWNFYLPLGMLTTWEGDPGIGKSLLVTWLACMVSTGGTLPDGQAISRGRVLYLSAEDDAAYTIRPRVDAIGGDPNRIHYMKRDLVLD